MNTSCSTAATSSTAGSTTPTRHDPQGPRRHLRSRARRRPRRPVPRRRSTSPCPARATSAWLYATSAQAAELDDATDTGIPLPTEADHDPEARTPHPTAHLRRQEPRHHRRPRRRTRRASSPPPSRPPSCCAARPPRPRRRARPCDVVNPAELLAAYSRGRRRPQPSRRRAPGACTRSRQRRPRRRPSTTHAGTCLVHFDNDRRSLRRPRRSPGHELVVIDHPEPVPLSPAAAATLASLAAAVADAPSRTGRSSSSAYGVEPGDADLYRRAVHVAVDHAAHQLRADPTRLADHLARTTTRRRPAAQPCGTTPPPASPTTGSSTTSPTTIAGLGPRPTTRTRRSVGNDLMLRAARGPLLAHRPPPPTDVEPLIVRVPRRARRTASRTRTAHATAPADQRGFIDRLVTRRRRPRPRCTTTSPQPSAAQDARRDWIIANWPHVVELEQVNPSSPPNHRSPTGPPRNPNPYASARHPPTPRTDSRRSRGTQPRRDRPTGPRQRSCRKTRATTARSQRHRRSGRHRRRTRCRCRRDRYRQDRTPRRPP